MNYLSALISFISKPTFSQDRLSLCFVTQYLVPIKLGAVQLKRVYAVPTLIAIFEVTESVIL